MEAKKLGDLAHGHTAGLLLDSDSKIGIKQAQYADSDVFSNGAAQRRLAEAISAIEQQEGSTVGEMFEEMRIQVEKPANNARIKSAQEQDRLSSQMSIHLKSACSSIPTDEMEARHVLMEAPFHIMQDGLLYRMDKPRAFKQDKMTRVHLHIRRVTVIYTNIILAYVQSVIHFCVLNKPINILSSFLCLFIFPLFIQSHKRRKALIME